MVLFFWVENKTQIFQFQIFSFLFHCFVPDRATDPLKLDFRGWFVFFLLSVDPYFSASRVIQVHVSLFFMILLDSIDQIVDLILVGWIPGIYCKATCHRETLLECPAHLTYCCWISIRRETQCNASYSKIYANLSGKNPWDKKTLTHNMYTNDTKCSVAVLSYLIAKILPYLLFFFSTRPIWC